jgi:hypothetical protein
MSKQSDLAKGTFSGDLTVDTNTLVVDSANNRVGVGTANPTEEIHGYSSGGDFSLKLESASATGTAYTYYKNADRQWATGIRGSVGDSYQIIDSNADTARLVIDTSGRVTMPYQPAFKIRYSSATGGDTGSEQDLTFKVQDQNIGGHYNPTTGKFTAPVAGTYMFVFSLLLSNMGGGDQFEMFIKKNGSSLQAAIRNVYSANSTGYGGYIAGLAVCQVPLSVNDFVTFQYYKTGSTATIYSDSQWANYSGHLIG